jgi:hypothetical protein
MFHIKDVISTILSWITWVPGADWSLDAMHWRYTWNHYQEWNSIKSYDEEGLFSISVSFGPWSQTLYQRWIFDPIFSGTAVPHGYVRWKVPV